MAMVAYYRVSTDTQTIDSQKHTVETVYNVDKTFADIGVSGTVEAAKRKEFANCISYLREGDTLIVWDLDRLGRDSIDVQLTMRELKNKGVNTIVHSMGVDLSTDAGELLITIFSKVAEMERKKILARTKAGREAAKAQGKHMGRPKTTTVEQVVELRSQGLSIAKTASELGCSVATVKRLQREAKANEVKQ